MKKPAIAILIVTSYLVLFQAAIYLEFEPGIIFTMFSISPFLILYMVYTVLKYGKPSQHTFDERFYDDWDYTRNCASTNNTKP